MPNMLFYASFTVKIVYLEATLLQNIYVKYIISEFQGSFFGFRSINKYNVNLIICVSAYIICLNETALSTYETFLTTLSSATRYD